MRHSRQFRRSMRSEIPRREFISILHLFYLPRRPANRRVDKSRGIFVTPFFIICRPTVFGCGRLVGWNLAAALFLSFHLLAFDEGENKFHRVFLLLSVYSAELMFLFKSGLPFFLHFLLVRIPAGKDSYRNQGHTFFCCRFNWVKLEERTCAPVITSQKWLTAIAIGHIVSV